MRNDCPKIKVEEEKKTLKLKSFSKSIPQKNEPFGWEKVQKEKRKMLLRTELGGSIYILRAPVVVTTPLENSNSSEICSTNLNPKTWSLFDLVKITEMKAFFFDYNSKFQHL